MSPPSLQSTEVMEDEDSEEDMDIGTVSLPNHPSVPGVLNPTPSEATPLLPPPACSNSASPCTDEDFAMFVAQEANKMLPEVDQDSLSTSSTPTPTSNDLLPPAFYEGLGVAKEDFAHIQHFGVTASCPSIPMELSKEAPNAVSNSH